MRILAITLILSLAACASVDKRTDRNDGVGFDNYQVPNAGGNQPEAIHL
jgi:hypothetical protein